MTWVSGGNLPPLLAAASLLDGRGHEVTVLGSGETRDAARRLGLELPLPREAAKGELGMGREGGERRPELVRSDREELVAQA